MLLLVENLEGFWAGKMNWAEKAVVYKKILEELEARSKKNSEEIIKIVSLWSNEFRDQDNNSGN